MTLLKALSQEEIEKKRKLLSPVWEYKNGKLYWTTRCSSFEAAIDLINTIASLANAQNHHPIIENEYDRVSLALWTHDCEGITQQDFDLAHAINMLLKANA